MNAKQRAPVGLALKKTFWSSLLTCTAIGLAPSLMIVYVNTLLGRGPLSALAEICRAGVLLFYASGVFLSSAVGLYLDSSLRSAPDTTCRTVDRHLLEARSSVSSWMRWVRGANFGFGLVCFALAAPLLSDPGGPEAAVLIYVVSGCAVFFAFILGWSALSVQVIRQWNVRHFLRANGCHDPCEVTKWQPH